MYSRAAGVERFFLAGNSLGGFLGWYYASRTIRARGEAVLLKPDCLPAEAAACDEVRVAARIGEIARVITPRAIIAQNVRMVYGDPRTLPRRPSIATTSC